MSPNPKDILRSVFGYDSFRGQQEEIIAHVVAGGDAMVLMPTGGGKSLCYQIPSLVRPGVGIVVSPLIALMQNQVDALRQYGVRAAALNSAQSYGASSDIERKMRAGEIDMVYVAPERLLSEGFLNLMDECRLALFAIDEAHCVSQWGHDFRREYLQLAILHERFPDVPRIALTATADTPTRKDIVERLKLEEGRMFVTGFDRPNIRYRVVPKSNPRTQLLQFLASRHGEAGIVYCLSRNKVDETAEYLNSNGFQSLPYHAGLDKDVRAGNQDRFLKEEGIVMAATIAFGMGIDKPDVRFVAHMDLPKSLEAYYQETGRAGRDGLPAEAWMAYGMQDVAMLRQFIENSEAADKQKMVEHRKLDALLGYCETARCRRQVLLEYFGDQAQPCGNCDTCLEPLASFDGTEAAQKALSAVYRTGQMFGGAHVIDVLLGEATEKTERHAHHTLPTFGIGKEFTREQWRSILRQMVALGLVVVDLERHGALRMGAEVRDVLRGERRIQLRQDPGRPPRVRGAKGAKPDRASLPDPDDEALFQALRAKRMELARAQGIPPYMIFSDRTLLEMVRDKPCDAREFGRLTGVGRAKLDTYGDDFLAVIADRA